MIRPGDDASFATISSLLWHEREALELLLFKLSEEQLILSAGATRWLARANDEVETVLADLRGAEILCAAEVETVAGRLDLGSAASLTAVAAAADEPWTTLLGDHRVTLVSLVGEVRAVTADNERLLGAGARAIGETLTSLHAVQTIGTEMTTALTARRSDPEGVDITTLTIDATTADTAYQAALQTTAQVRQISLLDFLR